MSKKIKLSKRNITWNLIFICMLFPILAPYYFLEHATWGTIIDLWTYVSLAFIAFFCLRRINRLSACICLPFFTYGVLLFSTVANGNSTVAVIAAMKHSIKVILLCCLVECLIEDKNRCDCFLYTVRNITLAFFLLNIITNIIYPGGIPAITKNSAYPYFIYGNVNATIRLVLPGMCSASILGFRKGKRISTCSWIFIFGFLFTFIQIYPTATTMLGVMIIMMWMLFAGFLKKYVQRVYMIVICIVFALEILVVVLANNNVIAFIAGLFNKSTDFTGRLVLWKNVIGSIMNNPIIGYGRQTLTEIKAAIGLETGCHNYFLDIMYQRGIVGVVLLMVLILLPVVSMKRQKVALSSTLYVLFGYCVALLVMFFAEPFFEYECYFMPIFYSVFLLTRKKHMKCINRVEG